MIITIIIRCADQFVADSWAAFLELLWPFYTSENFSSISTWARCRIFAVQDFAFTLGCPRMSANHTWLICQLWMGTAHIPVQVTGRQIDSLGALMMSNIWFKAGPVGRPKWCNVRSASSQARASPGHSENGLSLLVLMSEFASHFYMKERETISPFCPVWNMKRLAQTQRRWSGIQFRAQCINLKRGWLKWTKEMSYFLFLSETVWDTFSHLSTVKHEQTCSDTKEMIRDSV